MYNLGIKCRKRQEGFITLIFCCFFFFNKPELCIRKRHERFIDINVSNSDFEDNLRQYLITIIDAEPVYKVEMSYLQAAAPTGLIRDIKCHRSLETVITIRLNCTKINH